MSVGWAWRSEVMMHKTFVYPLAPAPARVLVPKKAVLEF